jgi:hypothetical protein
MEKSGHDDAFAIFLDGLPGLLDIDRRMLHADGDYRWWQLL